LIPGDPPVVEPAPNCLQMRRTWDSLVSRLLRQSCPGMSERRRFRLASTFKSCKRLFDASCKPCDKIASGSAINEWRAAVSQDSPIPSSSFCHDPSWLLKRRVRELVSGWGAHLCSYRDGDVPTLQNTYVPDQQGCFERRRFEGGTLSVSPADYHPSHSVLRVGVAKTKGKCRVVTMQPAATKRALTPVHNALYDFISSFDWCVRGDVTKEVFAKVVSDRREGEKFISGDYAGATDRIYTWATSAMVDVLCEDPNLLDEERFILKNSFRELTYKLSVCKSDEMFAISRGQMMGSLVGFPLLCLLNKACYDISCDISFGAGAGRIGRFNGDDCCFAGDDKFFNQWVQVTGTYGLVVNEEKTGISSSWIELNSNVYDVSQGKMISKPVLSFLRPDRYCPDDLLSDVIKGVSSFKPSTRLYVVCEVMRHEISSREISINALTRHWVRILIKRRWFRLALANPPYVKEKGVDRSLPVVKGPVPRPELLQEVTSISSHMTRQNVEYWRGRAVEPYSRRLVRIGRSVLKMCENPPSSFWMRLSKPRWRFLWPSELLDIIECDGFLCRNAYISPTEAMGNSVIDHPFLSLDWDLEPYKFKRLVQSYNSVGPPACLLRHVKHPPAVPFEECGGVFLWSV